MKSPRLGFRTAVACMGLAALAAGACATPGAGGQSVQFTETAPAATFTRVAPSLPAPSPTAGCTQSVGRVETLTYPGHVVREPIPLLVYLPPCYDDREQRFPVAYLLHGKPYDESHWEDLGVSAVADQGIDAGEWPAFMLVMPRLPEPIFSNSDGGPWSYEEEMLQGLVPFIDQVYLTDARAEARAIAGISRGGVWALEIGLLNPDVFGSVGALSPALAVNHPRPAYDPLQFVTTAAALPPNLFLAAGDADWARSATERLSQALTGSGWSNTLTVLPGGHVDTTWQSLLRPLLANFVAAWNTRYPGYATTTPSIP